MNPYLKDIKDTPVLYKYNDTLEMVLSHSNNVYVFKRTNPVYVSPYYEVVRGKKYTNPDGNVVYVYPSTSDFGKHAFCVSSANPNYIEKIKEHMWELSGKCPNVFDLVKILKK